MVVSYDKNNSKTLFYVCADAIFMQQLHKCTKILQFLFSTHKIFFLQLSRNPQSVRTAYPFLMTLNHYLEAMAKQLYDYWFVQFDFPDENGKPYKSSGGKMVWNEEVKRDVPKGWELKSYGELCDINKSSLSKRDNIQQIEYLDTSSLTEGYITGTQTINRNVAPSRAQRKVNDLTILYSCVRPRLLHYGIMSNPTENLIVSTGFATIDAKDKDASILLYLYLISPNVTEYLASKADTAASSYPSINPSDIASLRILMPPKSLYKNFQKTAEKFIRLIEQTRSANRLMLKYRDELLPLLMNGQVSVKQLNNDLAS